MVSKALAVKTIISFIFKYSGHSDSRVVSSADFEITGSQLRKLTGMGSILSLGNDVLCSVIIRNCS